MIRCPDCGAPPHSDCNDQGGVCLGRTVAADRATGLAEATCRSCGAPIVWVVMFPSGKRMPLDAKPLHGLIRVEPGAPATGHMRGKDAEDLYVSHFATCPNAAQHRKKPA